MSAPASIVEKLRDYEYEKDGCGGAVGDIYALIHRIADLEEEIYDLRIKDSESDAWRGRYFALLEECEASRPTSQGGGRMTASLLATAVALAVGLPIFALGERLRGRKERRLTDQGTPSTRKDIP